MNDEIVKQFLDNPVEGRLALSASLKNFIAFFFWYMYRQQFIFRPFHNLIIKKLEDIAFGRAEKKNLIINLPPRHGKSSICQMYCAWCYMLNPHSNCIYTSYSDDLTSSFSKDIRAIIESEAFKALTGIKLNKAKSGADYWATTIGGGFRAASMGGSITGFGCFSYGTRVITDKGIKRIGDIVEHKEDVSFLSWNGKKEWKKPIRYIKNNESEFLRIILNDGTIIDCTPDHKFYTQDGIKRADELTGESIFPSNALNNISFYAKFRAYILNRIIFIADKLSLFFCGNIFINRYSVTSNANPDSFSTPIKSCLNIANMRNRCSEIFSNFFISSWVGRNLFSLFYGKFMVPVVRSVINAILFVIRLSSIGKIFRSIIDWISVKMTNHKSFRSFANKSFGDKRMNGSMLISDTDKQVSFFGLPRLKNANGLVEIASNPSERGNLVDTLVFRDRKPSFIYKIGHFPSYCVTIPSNHNFFLAGRQEVLVGNSGVSGSEFGGCLIIDDPNKASSVKSQAELQNTIDYFNNTLKSRLNNQARTPIIVIMQRLALEDLTGYLLENEAEDWDIIKLQGLNEDTGEALWEEKYPAAELMKLKKVNPFVYYGQYQQEPIVVGGSVIKTEWFRYYNQKENYDYQFTFVTSDTAQKKGEANDFSVFSFWGKTFDNRLHLLDMVRGKWEADELRQQVKLCWQKWSKFKLPPYGFYIEDKSSGIGVIQEIKKTDPIPIIPITRARYKNDQGMWVAADKFSRVMTTAPYLANGWVYLPNGEKDCISAPLLAECAAFRADLSHKHDDMCFVDMTIIATSEGKKKVSDVCIGDKVLTPFGYSKVLATSKREAEVITNISLTGTPDHKVFNKYDYNFDKLKNMTYSQVSRLTFKDMFEWKKQIVFNLMERNIIVANRKDISQLATITKTRKVEQDFTEMFGSFIRERKYRKAIIFTIKMGIGLITIFQTLSAYHAKSILKDIGKRLWIFGKDQKCEKQMQEVERNVKSGTQVKKDISGTQSIRKNILNRSCKNKCANRVVKSSEHLPTQDIKQCATNAEIESCTSSLDNRKKIVYNIKTEAGCYYANGILVSNCDTLCDAVDVAFGSTGISSIFI